MKVHPFTDTEILNWLEKVMTSADNYCEIYLAGLRQGNSDASSYQIESNPEKFGVNTGRTLRDAIVNAMTEPTPISHKLTISSHNHEKLKSTKYFVEASGFEYLSLWREHRNTVDWVEDGSGFLMCIGHIDNDSDKGVYVSFRFATLNGKTLCFYECTSRYADHDMVTEFIKNNYPVMNYRDKLAITDASNFHLALSAVN